jgi:serine/threonine protein kinase
MRSLQFIKTIGAGAFGTVYLCRLSTAQGFQSYVAVKIIQDQVNSEMFLSRMRDEARLLGLLQDDAIIKVMDLVAIDGRQAVLMEYVEGADLESIIDSQGPPPARVLAEVGAAVAGALRRAHMAVHPSTGEALNVIHRDVKPANILVSKDGAVKLLDFGVARARFDARESFTGQLVLGTLNYMAPEYIVTGQVTQAVDIYGLGLALWQAATGEVFGQPKVRKKDHENRIRERLAELPTEYEVLGPVLQAMLAWDPESRPDSATAEDLLDESLGRLPGQGLRTWAKETIPGVLAARKTTPDLQGLVGTEIRLGETEEELVAPALPPLLEEDTLQHTAPMLLPTGDESTEETISEGESTESTELIPPVETAPTQADPEPVTVPILLGLLIGTTVGLVLLLGMAFFFFSDRF